MEQVFDSQLLIIEENSRNGNSLRSRFKLLNFKSIVAVHSLKNLDKLEGKRFDVIIYALRENTPEKLKLISILRDLFSDSRIILVSTKMTPELMQTAIRYGVHDFLHEPIKIESIPNLIARNIEQNHVLKYNILKQKSEILMKAIKSLIAAMEAKDISTSGHSMRVVNYAMMMANCLKLDEEARFILQLSAALHDIGKIGISDDILKKDSTLHEAEYDLVKSHPIIGSNIVGSIDELYEVARIIKHHHERYDGSGYPDGLKADEIPLYSRILAIVDTYEVLVSDRIYRPRLGKDEALNELRINSGTQFDPHLVELFIREIKKNNFKPEDKILIDERF
jgi:putative nucleotidyltransferase with HDIG domain